MKYFRIIEMHGNFCISFGLARAKSFSSVECTRVYREMLINKAFDNSLHIELIRDDNFDVKK